MSLQRLMMLMGGGGPYWQTAKTLFGANLIAYWPQWETTGTAIEDVSGNGRNGVYGAAAAAPELANLAFPFGQSIPHYDGGDYSNVYSAGFAGAYNPLAGFISLWCRIDEVAFQDIAYRKMFRFAVNSNNHINIQKSGTNTDALIFYYRAGGTITQVVTTQISTLWGGLYNLGITWSKADDRVRAYINGVQSGLDAGTLGTWSGSIAATTTNLGASDQEGTEPFIGHIGHVAVGNREATSAEMLALYNNLQRKLLVFEGDSRTAGTGATNIGYAYPAKTVRKLTGNWKCANVGESGQSVATMITQIAAEVSPLADPGLGKVAILWGGVNDNTDATTMHTRISTWCSTVRALGYKVVVCTEIDCQGAAHADWHTTNYLALNTLIRNNYATYADGLADLGGESELQDATDTTYYNADKTHLNDTGYGVVATVVGAAVNAL